MSLCASNMCFYIHFLNVILTKPLGLSTFQNLLNTVLWSVRPSLEQSLCHLSVVCDKEVTSPLSFALSKKQDSHRTYYIGMRVSFICQLDWVTRCSDIWSTMILGVSVRVFFFFFKDFLFFIF